MKKSVSREPPDPEIKSMKRMRKSSLSPRNTLHLGFLEFAVEKNGAISSETDLHNTDVTD